MSFAFHPELFEVRARAMERLEAADVLWFRDFSSVDLGHDQYSIEICGVGDEQTARKIEGVLLTAFSGCSVNVWLKDYGADEGWRVDVYIPVGRIP